MHELFSCLSKTVPHQSFAKLTTKSILLMGFYRDSLCKYRGTLPTLALPCLFCSNLLYKTDNCMF